MQRHQPCTRCYAHPPTLTAVDRRDGLNIPMLRAPTDTGLRRWRGSTAGTPLGARPPTAANKWSPGLPRSTARQSTGSFGVALGERVPPPETSTGTESFGEFTRTKSPPGELF